MQTITLTSFGLDINGLTISYSFKGENTTLSFDPPATCQLFLDHKLIEGFEMGDEPIILYECEHDFYDEDSEQVFWTTKIGYCLWRDFVQSFVLIDRHCQLIAEAREDKRLFDEMKEHLDHIQYQTQLFQPETRA
jgi:hypothetical protein